MSSGKILKRKIADFNDIFDLKDNEIFRWNNSWTFNLQLEKLDFNKVVKY